VVDRPADPSPRLIAPESAETPIVSTDPVLESAEEVVATAEPCLLNDRERQRMDLAMAGLSQFRPTAEPARPAPRAEVDPLSSVSAADWSGMDGMGEEMAPLPRSEPVRNTPRRESVAAPALEAASSVGAAPLPATDPIKGWVTADRLFSDFGD
jgi:hypothetical protein